MNTQAQEAIALAAVFIIIGIFAYRWLKQCRNGQASSCSHCPQDKCPSANKPDNG